MWVTYTRMMASVAKQVIAFEPDPWTFDVLQAKVADLQNVRLEKVAAGTHEGRVLLYRHVRFQDDPALHSGSSSLISSKTNVAEQEAVEVRQIDFIAYLERLNEDIGTLKVDIEGAEVDLLEALLDRPEIMKRIDYIFVETHEARIPGHEPRVKSLRDRGTGYTAAKNQPVLVIACPPARAALKPTRQRNETVRPDRGPGRDRR